MRGSILWGVMLFAAVAACARPDLSTDEGVLKLLNAERSGDRALTKDDVCISRDKALPGLVLVGHFAHDRGCMPGEVFVDGKRFAFAESSRPALARLGWVQAQGDARLALALLWARKGLMRFEGSVLDTKPETFVRSDFQAPKAERLEGGGAKVTLWLQDPSGMQCGKGYTRRQPGFAADGTLEPEDRPERFFVPCEPRKAPVPAEPRVP